MREHEGAEISELCYSYITALLTCTYCLEGRQSWAVLEIRPEGLQIRFLMITSHPPEQVFSSGENIGVDLI